MKYCEFHIVANLRPIIVHFNVRLHLKHSEGKEGGPVQVPVVKVGCASPWQHEHLC